MPISETYNEDCMIGMARYPDKFFDLAIVDPPYGIGINHNMGRRKGDKPSGHKKVTWDEEPPPVEYFFELSRVSKNQIIWGANHFISRMPYDSSCWLLWDKRFSEEVSFAQFELAWTSFNTTCKKYDKLSSQNDRIHPTQKPVQLYKWLLKNYGMGGGGAKFSTPTWVANHPASLLIIWVSITGDGKSTKIISRQATSGSPNKQHNNNYSLK